MSTRAPLQFCQTLLSSQKNRGYHFFIGLFILLTLWWCSTAWGWVNTQFIPSPNELWQTFIALSTDTPYLSYTLQEHWWISLTTILISFIFACLIGIPLGIMLASITLFRQLLDTWIEWFRPIPPLAYLNCVVLVLGFGFASKLAILFLAMLTPIILTTRSAVQQVPAEQILSSLTFGIRRWQLILYILIPSALPSILTGLRIAMGIGWSTLIAAEMVNPEFGIGALIFSAASYLRTDIMFIGMFCIAVTAWGIDILLRWFSERTTNRFSRS